MLPSEILTRAADLIAPEGKWAQGWYAFFEDVSGKRRECDISEEYALAVCWCAVGAINCAGSLGSSIIDDAKDALISVINDQSFKIFRDEVIAHWNDAPERTQSEVVSALRAAAELAKQQESASQ